jgi:hypothetical protein
MLISCVSKSLKSWDECDRKKAALAQHPSGFGIAALAAYLAKKGAKTLEQEELDPVLPRLSSDTSSPLDR